MERSGERSPSMVNTRKDFIYMIDVWRKETSAKSLNKPYQTLYGGSLGSWIDEERS